MHERSCIQTLGASFTSASGPRKPVALFVAFSARVLQAALPSSASALEISTWAARIINAREHDERSAVRSTDHAFLHAQGTQHASAHDGPTLLVA
eukprot:15462983-Alexandrium_andersonii.AAC.1